MQATLPENIFGPFNCVFIAVVPQHSSRHQLFLSCFKQCAPQPPLLACVLYNPSCFSVGAPFLLMSVVWASAWSPRSQTQLCLHTHQIRVKSDQYPALMFIKATDTHL